MWVFTVPSASTSAAAISALERPWAARSRISRSRSVRAAYSGPGRARRPRPEPLPQRAGGAGRHDLVAGGDRPHRGQQELRLGALEHEPARPRLDGRGGRLVVVEGGEHEHLRCALAVRRHQVARRGHPVDAAHPHVHQHHVGPALLDQAETSLPSPASPTTSRSGCEPISIAMPARNRAWSSTRATRIGHRSSRGTRASTTHWSPCGPAVTVPPTTATRSAMPSRPWP